MNWLLLDTSCPRAVVTLCKDGRNVAVRYLSETKKHSELLSSAVQEVLGEAKLEMKDLTGVGVGKGPGSFIGSRIAMAFAKGVCVALDIPLVGIGTLASLAHDPLLVAGVGIALIDARRGEYYAQEFTRSPEGRCVAHDVPHLVAASDLGALVASADFVLGTSLTEFQEAKVQSLDGPTAEGILGAFLARLQESTEIVDETESLVPDYVRDPDAKPMPT